MSDTDYNKFYKGIYEDQQEFLFISLSKLDEPIIEIGTHSYKDEHKQLRLSDLL